MTNRLISKICLGVAFLFVNTTAVFASSDFLDLASWQDRFHISTFNSIIKIENDGEVVVTEDITANFSVKDQGRGIIRQIPYLYRDNQDRELNIRLNILSVNDFSDKPLEYTTYSEGAYQFIRVGNASIYHNTPQNYRIKYSVNRAINFFEQHDELYWNVTGDQWEAPIGPTKVEVILPKGMTDTKSLQTACFQGIYGNSANPCEKSSETAEKVVFQSIKTLSPGEGLTIIIGWPKGLVTQEHLWSDIYYFLTDYLVLFLSIIILPFLTFLILFFKWLAQGRDPSPQNPTIAPEIDIPDNLTPAEIGALIDDSLDERDLTSILISLAVKGYLKIEEKDQKYTLYNNHQDLSTLKNFEKTFIEGIFPANKDSTSLSELKYNFWTRLSDIKTQIEKGLIEKKYYARSFLNIRGDYFSLGLGWITFPLLFFPPLYFVFPPLTIGYIASGVIIIYFGRIMSQKTQKGVNVLQRIRGMELFIRTAETDRLKMYEQENIFERILPYAIALGIADLWTKKCREIFQDAPDWYSSNQPDFHNNFRSFDWNNSFQNFNNSYISNIYSAPRTAASSGSSGFRSSSSSSFSSGGGFSGGGFGGGGGGRW